MAAVLAGKFSCEKEEDQVARNLTHGKLGKRLASVLQTCLHPCDKPVLITSSTAVWAGYLPLF